MTAVAGWAPTPIVDPRSGAVVASVDGAALLWLARMVVGEAGERASEAQARALVSTIVRRWFQVDHLTGRARTLAEMIRAYSTPLQESRRLEAGGRPGRIQGLTWAQIHPSIASVVSRTCRGELALTAAGAVHWAAPSLYAGHGLDTSSAAARLRTADRAVAARELARGYAGARYVHVAGAPVSDNVFSSTPASRTLPDPILGRGGAQARGGAGPLIALLFAVLGKVWWLA